MRRCVPVCSNQARRPQRRGDVGGPGQHAVGADHCPDVGRARHAVLERQDERVRADERREERKRGVVVVGLHRVEHHVHGPDLGGIGARARPHDEVAQGTPHPQPARSDRVEVRATRHQRHIESGAAPAVRRSTHRPPLPPRPRTSRRTSHGHSGSNTEMPRCRNAAMLNAEGWARSRTACGLRHDEAALFARRPARRSDRRCDPSTRACTTATPPIVATDSRGGR